MGTIEVFLSYAPADEGLCVELEEHLAGLKRENLVQAWYRRRIGVGEDWRNKVDERLTTANVVLLLVSSSYLASDYLNDVEMKLALGRAREGKTKVIPVLLRACDWKIEVLEKLSPLPRNETPITSWSNRDEAWAAVVLGIREAIGALPGGTGKVNEPTYEDAASRDLVEQLDAARARKRALEEAGEGTDEAQREILDLRRRLREGGRLRPGDALESDCR